MEYINGKILTVVIPHKNDLKNLISLIENLREFLIIDIIVVDDHSLEFKEISSSLKFDLENNFRLLKNNGYGAGDARNFGLIHVSTPYVLFSDSDDLISSVAFKALLEELCNLHEDIDIVFYKPSSARFDGGESSRAHSYANLFDKALSTGDYDALRYKWHVPWSKVFRSSFLFENNLKFDSVLAANDVMFSCSTGHLASRMVLSDIEFYTVIERNGSLRKQNSSEVLISRINVSLDYNKFLLRIGKVEHCELLWGLPLKLLFKCYDEFTFFKFGKHVLFNFKVLVLKSLRFVC